MFPPPSPRPPSFRLRAACGLVLAALCLPALAVATEGKVRREGEVTPQTLLEAAADRVMRAIDLMGTPYRPRGTSPAEGFDCSGFMDYVFRTANGVQLPRTAREMFALATDRARQASLRVQSIARDALTPGDLLFFHTGRLGARGVDHVGLYIGENRFVHAPASGGVVRIDTLDLPYWQRTYAGARRVDGLVARVDAIADTVLPELPAPESTP